MEGTPVEILLAEDNPGDVALTRRALRDTKLRNNLHVVTDGEAAIRFLHRKDGHGEAPRPDLVLLDINMPKKSGLEVLAEIKADPELRTIPVCILTTSEDDRDILSAYAHHANAFVTKPVDLAQFVEVVRKIEDFWFTIVKLPKE
jgi:chemotaxis family two-component system response regulator Rcp1